jgi:hypothetical protein
MAMLGQYFLRSGRNQLVRVALVISLLSLLLPGVSRAQAEPRPAEAAWLNLQGTLYFIENRGQLDPQVSYYLQGRDKTLYFTSTGVTLALAGDAAADTMERWVVKLDFVGGSARPIGQAQTETVVSYFLGHPDQWQTGLPTYARLIYPDLWPGIDLVYTVDDNQIKYQFVVRPAADPARIRLAYRGATAVQLTAAGQLEVSTPAGSFNDAAPSAYQMILGRRVPVSVAYTLAAPTADGTSEYGFRLGAYDPTCPLVLDPAVIVYAGFLGGSQRDNGYGIAVDAAGNAYVTGETRSNDFPAVVGPDLTHNGGVYNGDAFIAKVRANGTGLVYAGFIGGSTGGVSAGEDYGYGVAVDVAGNAYVTGVTYSSDFPVTLGAYDVSYNGGGDAFVAKVNAAGTGLTYATYIGDTVNPNSYECGRDIAVDGAGSAYVLVDTSFGPFGGYDTSVVKLNAAGTGADYLRYIGGTGNDYGDSLAVAAGYAYVTGKTYSSDFPVTVGAYDTTYNGGSDAFVAKVNASGTGLVYATYIAPWVTPSADDNGDGIAVDGAGIAYVLVNTSSGPFGGYDASVAKLNAAGSALIYVKYIGGSSGDTGSDLALDSGGRVYVSGNTTSTDFPATNWPATSYDAPQETFAVQFWGSSGTTIYAGFITGGGAGSAGIAADSSGNAYVTGTSWYGNDFPAIVGPDLTTNGERDAFVVKIAPYAFYLPLIFK